MKAKLINARETGKFYHDKTLTRFYSVVVVSKGKMVEVAKAYIFASSTGSTIYATLFANNGKDVYVRGSGKASGGGYHMTSSALDSAIDGAGFKLYNDKGNGISIDSAGDSAMERALKALPKALGYGGAVMLVKS